MVCSSPSSSSNDVDSLQGRQPRGGSSTLSMVVASLRCDDEKDAVLATRTEGDRAGVSGARGSSALAAKASALSRCLLGAGSAVHGTRAESVYPESGGRSLDCMPKRAPWLCVDKLPKMSGPRSSEIFMVPRRTNDHEKPQADDLCSRKRSAKAHLAEAAAACAPRAAAVPRAEPPPHRRR